RMARRPFGRLPRRRKPLPMRRTLNSNWTERLKIEDRRYLIPIDGGRPMTRHAMWLVALFAFLCAAPLSAGAADDAQQLADRIDELIGAKLADANIERAPAADDATFSRRLSLDLTGKIPASAEARQFLRDTREDKRRQAIDRLLDGAGYGIHSANVWTAVMLPEVDDGFAKQALQASF